jgi:lipoyl(octanoyl) transferase
MIVRSHFSPHADPATVTPAARTVARAAYRRCLGRAIRITCCNCIMPEVRNNADAGFPPQSRGVSVDFHLLGCLPFDQFLNFQRRLAYDLGGDTRQRILVLLCEHDPLITIGRRGSRGHIQLSGEQLRQRGLPVVWLNRGGGCILHGAGQLSIYALCPLAALGWSVGDYMLRLQTGVLAALRALCITARGGQNDYGVWGRTGQLCAMGVAVRHGISQHGLFLNVNPAMGNYRMILTPEVFNGFGNVQRTMGCLSAERSQGIKMSDVRATLVDHLPAALSAERYNVFTGHPLMPHSSQFPRNANARAS